MEDSSLTYFDACSKNELALVPYRGLALQRSPSMSSGPRWSNMPTLQGTMRPSGLPCLPHCAMSDSPLVLLNVSSGCPTGDGSQPQITISGQGLKYLFQGLSERGIALPPMEGLSRRCVGITLPPTLEHASVLLPCSRVDACRPTSQVSEHDNVTTDSVESAAKYECVSVDSSLHVVPDSLLDDATVPGSHTCVGPIFEMHHSTASNNSPPSQVNSHDKAGSGGSNPKEASPAISGKIGSKNPLKSVVTVTENTCRLSQDAPTNDITIDTPAHSPRKSMCTEVPDPPADDNDCSAIPQFGLDQCPPPTLEGPTVASSNLPPETSLGEQMIVSVAKGLLEVASKSAKEPASGPLKSPCTVQDSEAVPGATADDVPYSSSSLVLAEREIQLVQMDDSDEELEFPASAPGAIVIPTPPPLPSIMPVGRRSLPSAGVVGMDMCTLHERSADDFNLGDLLSQPPSNNNHLFGEHAPLAVTPTNVTPLDLKLCPPLQSGPEGAHEDTQTLAAVATICKRAVDDVSQYEAPSPKKLKSSTTTGEEAEKEGEGLDGVMVEVGKDAKSDPVGIPAWSGCCEPLVALHEGDSPFPAALPKETARLFTSDNQCGVPDDEADSESDSDADESFTCLPCVSDSETTFHVVPDQTLANSPGVEASALYYTCPATKEMGVTDRPAATSQVLETVEMLSFENRGSTNYSHVFAGSSRVDVHAGMTAFNLSKPRLRVGLSRHARVAPLHRNYKRQQ